MLQDRVELLRKQKTLERDKDKSVGDKDKSTGDLTCVHTRHIIADSVRIQEAKGRSRQVGRQGRLARARREESRKNQQSRFAASQGRVN
jgi:hypothetical protein